MTPIPTFVENTDAPPGDPFAFQDHLERAVELDREINRLMALRSRALLDYKTEAEATFHSESVPWQLVASRGVRAELAAALKVTERAMEGLIGYAEALTSRHPSTLDALESGAISYRHAVVLVDECSGLDLDDAQAIERKVLGAAERMTPSGFRRAVRIARERRHPESIEQRHDDARATRGVSLDDIRDGMSVLSAVLPTPIAHAAFNRITSAARGIDTPEELRTLDQRRADLLATVLLTSEGGAPFGVVPGEDSCEDFVKWFRGITPEVFITVPALTLLGKSHEPAMLNGLVPIDPVTARILVGAAKTFTRVLTDPENGAVLSVGRDRYTVPKDLRRYLMMRDLTCRFPGCFQPASKCDLDHTVEWQYGGETAYDNLAFLCRGHHLVKGETEWSVEQEKDGSGVLTWMSPNGRMYRTHPGAELAG